VTALSLSEDQSTLYTADQMGRIDILIYY